MLGLNSYRRNLTDPTVRLMSAILARTKATKCVWLRALVCLLLPLWAWQSFHALSLAYVDPWYPNSILPDRVDDLVELCAQPHEELTEDCQNAMDAYFEVVPLEHWDTTWISIANRLTYGRAFEDPVGDRKRVFEALANEECRLESGQTVRWDLKQSCHADAFANLSVVLWACDKRRNLQELADNLAESSDELQFARDRRHAERLVQSRTVYILEAHWFNKKCAEHKLSDLQIDADRDSAQHELLQATATRLGEDWVGYSNIPESYVLKSLAARLGDESSALRYYPSRTQAEGKSWHKHISKEWPWTHNSLFGRSSLASLFVETDGPAGTEKRMQLGISLAVSLHKSEFEFDWVKLVRKICTLEKPEEETCQTVIEEMKRSFDSDSNRELQVLEDIEKVSMELGLYD